MTSGESAISQLLFRYAELMDGGRFEDLADLFGHARLRLGTRVVDGAEFARLMGATVLVYADGTPRTRHVVTNAVIDVDEVGGTASCRSYYTVLQQVDPEPLRVIGAGRYHDRFDRADGVWRFAERDYSMLDLVDDQSRHLRNPPQAR